MKKITALIALAALVCGHSFASEATPTKIVNNSPGNATYMIDPVKGDDANPPGKPWRSYGKLNSLRLAPGDQVIISPGLQEETLKPSGEGTAEKPIVIRFLPGVHTISIKNVLRLPMFVSNAQDTTAPKPVGILIQNVKHLRMKGGGVEGPEKTEILYDGRMVEVFNDHSEDIQFKGLVFDLKRPTVSEFRVVEVSGTSAVIQIAEGSDYAVENGKFVWKGDWNAGSFCQELDLATGQCRRAGTPRGWGKMEKADGVHGQTIAQATDLGGNKVRLDFPDAPTGLKAGYQYHFRNIVRDSVGVLNARSKDIVFQDCDFYALTGMGVVSQFTENITYLRVNVAPPKNTIRTCPAWADIFQYSNCKGNVLVDSCRLSGMQDDALNCHGTYLRIVKKVGDRQLLVQFVHRQTYGFEPYAPGDEIAVMNPSNLREYPGNPRAKVVSIEMKSPKEWLMTLDGPAPKFEANDVIENITWNPNLTIRNTQVSVDPVRGFLLSTRGKVVVEGNELRSNMPGILVEGDASNWMESSPLRDVLIRKNRFINCRINIGANIKEIKPEEPIHENIRITENYFKNGGISIRGTKGVTITDNTSLNNPLSINLEKSCTETKVENNLVEK
jgi:parallel beta-helix repeat protein